MLSGITLIKEVSGQDIRGTQEYRSPSARKWDALCPNCDSVWQVALNAVKSNKIKGCGCLSKSHGDSKQSSDHYLLFVKYHDMIKRSKSRTLKGDVCSVNGNWDTYEEFKKDALAAGWSKSNRLYICRNGDTGDYNPDNARFDTQQSNSEEERSKYYIFINPQGEKTLIYNLEKFCRNNDVTKSAMRAVFAGTKTHHKGWTKFIGE